MYLEQPCSDTKGRKSAKGEQTFHINVTGNGITKQKRNGKKQRNPVVLLTERNVCVLVGKWKKKGL